MLYDHVSLYACFVKINMSFEVSPIFVSIKKYFLDSFFRLFRVIESS